jgi:hypothetical protein
MPYLRTGARMRRRGGVGEYPGNPCYDPNRPWWLPQILNDSNEQACMLAAQNSVGITATIGQLFSPSVIPTPVVTPATPSVPVGYNANTGTVDSSNTTGATTTNPMQVVIPTGITGSGNQPNTTCDPTQATWNDPSTWCASQWLMALAAGLFVGILVLGSKKL